MAGDLDLPMKPRDPEALIRVELRDFRCPQCDGQREAAGRGFVARLVTVGRCRSPCLRSRLATAKKRVAAVRRRRLSRYYGLVVIVAAVTAMASVSAGMAVSMRRATMSARPAHRSMTA